MYNTTYRLTHAGHQVPELLFVQLATPICVNFPEQRQSGLCVRGGSLYGRV